MKIKDSVKTNSLQISKSVPKRYVERIEKLLIKHHHCILISQDDVGELYGVVTFLGKNSKVRSLFLELSTSARRRKRNLCVNK